MECKKRKYEDSIHAEIVAVKYERIFDKQARWYKCNLCGKYHLTITQITNNEVAYIDCRLKQFFSRYGISYIRYINKEKDIIFDIGKGNKNNIVITTNRNTKSIWKFYIGDNPPKDYYTATKISFDKFQKDFSNKYKIYNWLTHTFNKTKLVNVLKYEICKEIINIQNSIKKPISDNLKKAYIMSVIKELEKYCNEI